MLSGGSAPSTEPDTELSLLTWWKEVVLISIVTAFMMNLLFTQSAVHWLRDVFRLSRRPPVSFQNYIVFTKLPFF
jgi:hypothetical protein